MFSSCFLDSKRSPIKITTFSVVLSSTTVFSSKMFIRNSQPRPLYIRSQMKHTKPFYLYSSRLSTSFTGKTRSETNQEQPIPTTNPTNIHPHSTFKSTIRGPPLNFLFDRNSTDYISQEKSQRQNTHKSAQPIQKVKFHCSTHFPKSKVSSQASANTIILLTKLSTVLSS